MMTIEEIKADYIRLYEKAKKEDLTAYQMGYIAALGSILGKDCPEVA